MRKILQYFLPVLLVLQVACFNYLEAQNCSINAGVNASICLGAPITLDGSLGGPSNASTVQWSLISQPAGASTVISNTNSLYTTAGTPTIIGAYTFRLSATCGDNVETQDEITITVNPVPSIPTQSGPFDFPCYDGTPIILTGSAPTGGETVSWETIGGNLGSFGSSTSASTTFTPKFPLDECSNVPYSITIKYTISNASGCERSETRTYSFSRSYPLAAAAVPTPVCGSGTMLKGSCPGAGTALWSTVSKPIGAPDPVFSSASSRNSYVGSLVPGSYIFRYTLSGGCNSGSVDVNVDVTGGSGVSNANAGQDQYFCNSPGMASLAGSSPAVGETVTWSMLSGGTTVSFGSPNSANTTVSGLSDSGAPYHFLYKINNPGGCSSIDTVAIYVYPKLELTNTGYSICHRTGVVNAVGDVTFGSYGYKQLDSVQASITYLSGPLSSVDGGWSVVSGTEDAPIPVNVTLGGTVTVMLAGDSGSTPLYVPGLANPESGLYSIENYFFLYNVGTYKFRVSYTTKCGTFETIVTATRGYMPAAGVNAGTDVALPCAATTATLAGSIPDGAGNNYGLWRTVQMPSGATDPINGNNQMLRNPSLAGLVNGTYIFRYANNPGPNCGLVTDDIKVVISSTPPPSPNAGTDETLCAGTISLDGSAIPSTALGSWSVVSPTGAAVTFSDSTIANPQVSGLLPGTNYIFRYTLTNGCGSSSDDIAITTLPSSSPVKPMVSFVSGSNCGVSNQSFPSTFAVGVNHTAPSATQTGSWTVVASPASALTSYSVSPVNSGRDNITLSLSGEASVSFIYCLTESTCAAQSVCDTVTRLYKKSTNIVNAGPDQQLCSIASYPASISLTGTSTALSTEWSLTYSSNGQPVTINTPGANSTTVSLPADGTYRFQYTYLSTDPSCAPLTDYVEVNTSTGGSIALAGDDISFCDPTGTSALNATALTSGTGQWQIEQVFSGGTPAISNINSPTSSITFTQSGSVMLRWSSFGSNADCGPSSSDLVMVTYIAPAKAGNDQSLCESTSSNLNAQNASPGTGSWIQVSGPNTAGFGDASSNQTIVSGLISGSYTFRWSVTGPSGSCVTSDDVVVTVSSGNPQADAGVDFESCSSGSKEIRLNATAAPTGSTGTWTVQSFPAAASAGSFSNQNNPKAIYNGVTTPGTYVFAWTIDNGICSSTDFLTVTAGTDSCPPMPVKLISFNAKSEGAVVNLSWTVADEVAFKNYEVMHSLNGRLFSTVGVVDGENQDAYSFVHTTPIPGENYYRLKMNDDDGTFSYSKINFVKSGTVTEVSVYPNPVKSFVNIKFLQSQIGQQVKIELYNTLGQKVVTKSLIVTNLEQTLPVNHLTSGYYVLKLLTESGKYDQKKIQIAP